MANRLVRVYHRGKMTKPDVCSPCGSRSTDAKDFAADLTAHDMKAPERIKGEAAKIGPAVVDLAYHLFEPPLLDAGLSLGFLPGIGLLHRPCRTHHAFRPR